MHSDLDFAYITLNCITELFVHSLIILTVDGALYAALIYCLVSAAIFDHNELD